MSERQTFDDIAADPRGDADDGPIYDGFTSEDQPDVNLFDDAAKETDQPAEPVQEDEPKEPAQPETPAIDMREILDVPRQVQEALDRQNATQTTAQEIANLQKAEQDAADRGDVEAFKKAVYDRAVLEARQKAEPVEQEKSQRQQMSPEQVRRNSNPEAAAFVQQNPWFNTDPVMRAGALALEERLHSQGYTGQALYKELEKQVRDNFPHKFESPAKRAKVEAGGRKSAGGTGMDNLSGGERSAARDYAEDFADSLHGGDKAKALAHWIKSYKGSKK